MGRFKLQKVVYLHADQDAHLRALSGVTRVPVAALIRLAVDEFLALHPVASPACADCPSPPALNPTLTLRLAGADVDVEIAPVLDPESLEQETACPPR